MQITYSVQLRPIALLFLFTACFPILLFVQLLPAVAVNAVYFYAVVTLCSLVFLALAFGLTVNTVRVRQQQLHVRSGFFTCRMPLSSIQRIEHISWAEWLCSHSQPMQRRRGIEFLDCQTGWFDQADGRAAFLLVFTDDMEMTVLHGEQFDVVLSGRHELALPLSKFRMQNA